MLSRPAPPSAPPSSRSQLAQQPTGVASPLPRPGPIVGLFCWLALALVFIRISLIHQVLTQKTGVNNYLLYIVGIPAAVGLIASGGFMHVFRRRPALYWVTFGLWLLVAMLFSSWRGGSVPIVVTFLRIELFTMFVAAGLVVRWRDFRRMMLAIALGGFLDLAWAQLFSQVDENERLGLQFGTIANSNDYAGHLIYVMPFMLAFAMTAKNWFYRLIAMGGLAYGVYLALATASRGAAIGILAGAIFYLFAAPNRHRVVMLVMAPILLLAAISFLPSRAWERILSFSQSNTSASAEALESSQSRSYLLWKSIEVTFQNPVVGVGAGQFSSYEGKTSRDSGLQGYWHDTHNSYTQISSENGLPAVFLYLAAIVSTMLLLGRVYQTARRRPELRDMAITALCLRLSLVSYCVTVFFLNFGYTFYLPLMAGLSIALANILEDEFPKVAPQPAADKMNPPVPSPPVLPQPPVRRRGLGR